MEEDSDSSSFLVAQERRRLTVSCNVLLPASGSWASN